MQERSVTRDALAEGLGIGIQALEEELQRKPEPRQSFLNKLAKSLAIPRFAFFMSEAPPLNDTVIDFRSEQPSPSYKSAATMGSIQVAVAIQELASEFVPASELTLPTFRQKQRKSIEEFAQTARTFFEISLNDQIKAEDTRVFYNICRKKIEDKGVFVIHDSFPSDDGSGFCLSGSRHPVIVVNTRRQNRGRRLFTLIHELAHVLMRVSGISDPFVNQNTIERDCNRFAASFLVPKESVESLFKGASLNPTPDLADVYWASRLTSPHG